MKPKLKIHVGGAKHFLSWELPFFKKHFEVVETAGEDTVLFVFGPDVLPEGAEMPALRRVAMLFPGWWCNPYHNLEYRQSSLALINSSYDLIFVNPGPVHEAYKTSDKVALCQFSINTEAISCKNYRKKIDTLLHVSSDHPQKDRTRSDAVMRLTGLPYELFPPTDGTAPFADRLKRRFNAYCKRLHVPSPFTVMPYPYVSYRAVIKKYQNHDAFVHIAAEIPDPLFLDGKYTAALMEAGATGAILFWHDTFGLGNDLETVFALPKEPAEAAREILNIRRSLDVEPHSRRTREEMLDRFSPERSVNFRAQKIKELL